MSGERISIERWLDAKTVEEFLAIYRAAFAPLEPLAAGRQSLTDDEFREEMADPSVLKFVGRDRDRSAVAMSFMATDLHSVPWISPAFFAARYPEQFERGAIWYLGALLVRPDLPGGPWVRSLCKEMVRAAVAVEGIVAFDCCEVNDRLGIAKLVDLTARRVCHFDQQEVDAQRYYAFVFQGFREEVPVEERRPQALDLRDPDPSDQRASR